MQPRKAFAFAGLLFFIAFVLSRVGACLDAMPPYVPQDAGANADNGYGFLISL